MRVTGAILSKREKKTLLLTVSVFYVYVVYKQRAWIRYYCLQKIVFFVKIIEIEPFNPIKPRKFVALNLFQAGHAPHTSEDPNEVLYFRRFVFAIWLRWDQEMDNLKVL